MADLDIRAIGSARAQDFRVPRGAGRTIAAKGIAPFADRSPDASASFIRVESSGLVPTDPRRTAFG